MKNKIPVRINLFLRYAPHFFIKAKLGTNQPNQIEIRNSFQKSIVKKKGPLRALSYFKISSDRDLNSSSPSKNCAAFANRTLALSFCFALT